MDQITEAGQVNGDLDIRKEIDPWLPRRRFLFLSRKKNEKESGIVKSQEYGCPINGRGIEEKTALKYPGQ